MVSESRIVPEIRATNRSITECKRHYQQLGISTNPPWNIREIGPLNFDMRTPGLKQINTI